MLSLELNKIKEIKAQIYNLELSAKNGLIAEADVIAATGVAMKKIEKLKHDYVDRVHSWNERDFMPRTKDRGDGVKVNYFMSRVGHGKERKQIIAKDINELYEKLFQFYALDDTTIINPNASLLDVYNVYTKVRFKDAFEFKTISTQTAYYDQTIWKRFFADSKLIHMKVASITQGMVFDEYKRITGAGNIERKTFNKAKGLLDAVFDTAMAAKIIENNPSRMIPKSRLKFKIPKNNSEEVYTKETRDKLFNYLNTVKPTVYSLAVQLALCFPLRISELTALTWDDYAPDEDKITVSHEIVFTAENGKRRVAHDVPHTKSNTAEGIRSIPVSDEAKIIFEKLRQFNGDKKYILNSSGNGKKPIGVNNFNRHLKEFCEKCGVKYYSSHKIRFFGATELFNKGVEPEEIRRIMGHTTLQMTEHYNRTDGKSNIDMTKWNKIFSSDDETES